MMNHAVPNPSFFLTKEMGYYSSYTEPASVG